jgi:hypothetical protein
MRVKKWKDQYNNLVNYRKLNPYSWPVKNDELFDWCKRQRVLYKRGKIAEHRVKRFDEIGFPWDLHFESWMTQYNYLKQFRSQFPNRWPTAQENYPIISNKLGQWLTRQRRAYDENNLTKEKMVLLNKLGFIWTPRTDSWETQFQFLIAFRMKYPHRWPARKVEFPKGNKLGEWFNNERKQRSHRTQEQIRKLENIGFVFNLQEKQFMEKYHLLCEYRKIHPLQWPTQFEVFQGVKLGVWCAYQRKLYREGRLPERRMKLLQDIKFRFSYKLNE